MNAVEHTFLTPGAEATAMGPPEMVAEKRRGFMEFLAP
jgi:hypothetical protein